MVHVCYFTYFLRFHLFVVCVCVCVFEECVCDEIVSVVIFFHRVCVCGSQNRDFWIGIGSLVKSVKCITYGTVRYVHTGASTYGTYYYDLPTQLSYYCR